jgi:hypothetical protein
MEITTLKAKTASLYEEVKKTLDKYPRNGPWTAAKGRESQEDKIFLLPRIIDLYRLSKKKNQDLLEEVYFFARFITIDVEEKEVKGIAKYYKAFSAIQQEGASYYLNLGTEAERIADGRLYKSQTYGIVLTGNIPRQGTSSVCSNCLEPITYSQVACRRCNYPLIGPHGYGVNISRWQTLTPDEKIYHHEGSFLFMTASIRKLGHAWNDPDKKFQPLYKAMGLQS